VLAFTFPGQGSQRPGMGRAWVDHPSWEVVGEASAVAGRDLARLLLEADQDELTLTANAQLATYVVSLVVLDAIERVGIEPTACAGHSLGEYTALTASGALGFEDGVRLVVERGEAMHHAAEERPGTMAAVLGAEDDDVEAACQRAEGEVWVANYNAPGQVVIAGTPEAVGVAGTIAKELGARRVMPFPVAGAFHTALMAPARSRLRKALGDAPFSAPEVPVVANVDARAHPGSTEWPGLLSAQLCSPVRWRQSLVTLGQMGATRVVEVGPGGVLTGLARRTLPEVEALSVASPDDLAVLVETLSGSETWQAYASAHQGEHLYTSERVVVSPSAGVFSPDPGLAAPGPGGLTPVGAPLPGGGGSGGAGEIEVVVGALLGHVGETEVRTPFAGQVVGFLAHSGERVMAGQPLAWLRVSTAGS
jgi:[acyl-carrier-protein] S-malonyltransferase